MELKDILSIEIDNYFRVTGKKADDYDMHGVNIHGSMGDIETGTKVAEKFLEHIPGNTEVVVEYKVHPFATSSVGKFFCASGVALIPKKEDDGWTDNKGLSRKNMES